MVRPLPYNTITLQNGNQELNPMLLETLNDDSETLFGNPMGIALTNSKIFKVKHLSLRSAAILNVLMQFPI